MNTKTTEELVSLTQNFEASPAYTNDVQDDTVAMIKAMVAQTVHSQKNAYTDLSAALAAKYADSREVKQYLRATSLMVITHLEDYAAEKLARLQRKGAQRA